MWIRCLIGWHKWYYMKSSIKCVVNHYDKHNNFVDSSEVDVPIRKASCIGPGCKARKWDNE